MTEVVEVGARRRVEARLDREGAAEELHAEQREDDDEEQRGDESPDLSANFFSNEDSSDSGDVPIRMSGSLPDIPAETLFKGSVLEDDGFFDEDDFEDVGNGEDVADLFA